MVLNRLKYAQTGVCRIPGKQYDFYPFFLLQQRVYTEKLPYQLKSITWGKRILFMSNLVAGVGRNPLFTIDLIA